VAAERTGSTLTFVVRVTAFGHGDDEKGTDDARRAEFDDERQVRVVEEEILATSRDRS
jgi:hypothetical protein